MKYTNTTNEPLNFVVEGREHGVQATESIAPGETKALTGISKDHQHWVQAYVNSGALVEASASSKAEGSESSTRRKATSE